MRRSAEDRQQKELFRTLEETFSVRSVAAPSMSLGALKRWMKLRAT